MILMADANAPQKDQPKKENESQPSAQQPASAAQQQTSSATPPEQQAAPLTKETNPAETKPSEPKPAVPTKPSPPPETEEQKAFRLAYDEYVSTFWKGHAPIERIERGANTINVTLSRQLDAKEKERWKLPETFKGYDVTYNIAEKARRRSGKRLSLLAIILSFAALGALYML